MGAMMVWVDGCMDGVDECVDGWDEGLEGMRVWRAILLQWGAEFSKAPSGHHDPRLPSPSEGHEVEHALDEGREGLSEAYCHRAIW